jgi:hypothetical protein
MGKGLLFALLLPALFLADKKPQPKITFKEGGSYHVVLNETLRLTQQFSQVDSALVEPSTRFTTYHFTENIDKVFPDGSALVAATLDSVMTKIFVSEVIDRNEYFRFNSNNDYDIGNRLRDIRALPRAQFLGQTLRYVLSPDGRIHHFENLSAFQNGIIARAYDYDMLHALLSFTDSLRVGQLLEQGSGAFAAASGNKVTIPYTLTEINVTGEISATATDKRLDYRGVFKNPPAKVDYLEGIAYPINISDFSGGMKGSLTIENGLVTSQQQTDSATMKLSAEGDAFRNDIYRKVTLTRTENEGLRGAQINVKELRSYKPPTKPQDSMTSIHLTPPRKRN